MPKNPRPKIKPSPVEPSPARALAVLPPWETIGEVPPTPFYLYSETALTALWNGFTNSFAPEARAVLHVHFALKSNHNPRVIEFFRARNAGLDLVSGGELDFALKSGFAPSSLIMSGVGKSREEMARALGTGIDLIVVESEGELERLQEVAGQMNVSARVALRVNPDVDAKTHPYISTGMYEHKFGIDFKEASRLAAKFFGQKTSMLKLRGLSIHIGSQMMDLGALEQSFGLVLKLARKLRAAGATELNILDVGGGLGIPYAKPFVFPKFAAYGRLLSNLAKLWVSEVGDGAKVYTETGRALIAQAGYLYTRVLGLKANARKNFCILDASMTELLRPALYQAEHVIEPLAFRRGVRAVDPALPKRKYDFVGPVCESSDVLGTGRSAPASLKESDLFRILSVGAYGYVMASTYNLRPLPAEYWLRTDGTLELVRERHFPNL